MLQLYGASFNLVIEKLMIPTYSSAVDIARELIIFGEFQSRNREAYDSNSMNTVSPGTSTILSFQSRNREAYDSNDDVLQLGELIQG